MYALIGDNQVSRNLWQAAESFFQARGWPLGLLKTLWMVGVAVEVVLFVMLSVLFLVYLERKVGGYIQSRLGPMRVGRWGLLQTVADALKLFLKEDTVPARADRALFMIAPFVVFLPVLLAFIVLPFGDRVVVADLNLGVLFILAVGSLPVIGVIMAGWGSNNKYSLLGAMRGAAQTISYEIPLVLAVLSVVAVADTLSTVGIVEAQQRNLWFILVQPVAFLLYLTAGLAEINRTPFDLPEAESELVAGFHTEYSGMRWAFFFLAEFGHLFFISALCTTLFLGGWSGPAFLPSWVWFFAKTYIIVFAMMWIRWTLPRLRVDQLMRFSWKVLIPIGLLNLVVTAFWRVLV